MDGIVLSYTPHIVMCRPRVDDFEPSPAHPEFGFPTEQERLGRQEFEKDPRGFRIRAWEQSCRLSEVFRQSAANVTCFEQVPGLPNMVYGADPMVPICLPGEDGGTINIAILASFTNPYRQIEVGLYKALVRHLDPSRVFYQSPYALEGGDFRYDPFRDFFWAGYTDDPSPARASHGRTDIRSHDFVTEKTGVDVVGLKTVWPFFHIDTAMAPLPRGHILVFEDGMMPESFDLLKAKAFQETGMDEQEYMIKISLKDANAYAANLHAVGNILIMSQVSEILQDRLRTRGYDVVDLDMSKLMGGAGGVNCSKLEISQRRIVGGYMAEQNHHLMPQPIAA